MEVMKRLSYTLGNIIYSYDTSQFMPIYRDGQLDNRDEFIKYKTRCALRTISKLVSKH